MKDVCVILGSHPRTRSQFDFARLDCDIWVFNEALSNGTFPRADGVFQLHDPAIFRNPKNRNDPKHYDWLKTQRDCVVYMQDIYPDIPASVRYPRDMILAMLGNTQDHFLSSSVALALALAVFMRYKRIEVYGVAMETNTEYQFQREGVSFWLGFARGRGCEVIFADTTYNVPLYGYEGKVTVDYEEFGKRIAELTPQTAALTAQYIAAEADTRKAVELFAASSDKKTEDALYACIRRQLEIGEQLGVLDGARQENARYQGKADKMRDAAEGAFLFSRQEFESGLSILKGKGNGYATQFVSAGTTLGHIHENIKRAAKGSKKRDNLVAAYRNHLIEYFKINNLANVYRGAAEENARYMTYLDKHVRAAGGAKSEAVLLEEYASNAV